MHNRYVTSAKHDKYVITLKDFSFAYRDSKFAT